MYSESGVALNLEQALTKLELNEFAAGTESVINRGIGSAPVWVHLRVSNPGDHAQSFKLFAGLTWLDKLDLYVVQNGRLLAHTQSGDERANPIGLTPNLGFLFPVSLPVGVTDILLRVESIDPLVLPIELLSDEQADQKISRFNYLYGFIYGFLIALIAYNALLYLGLGTRSYLYYSIYLCSVIMLNLAYTGQGQSWIWPGNPSLQRYLILLLMLVFVLCGFLFVSRFLILKEHAPRAWRLAKWFQSGVVLLMAFALLIGSQLMAALLAFSAVFVFTLWVLWFATITVTNGRIAGRYFLAAALCSMIGIAITTLAVWGKIVFNDVTYHALEFGIILESVLLALALAYQMRRQQRTLIQAENLARLDPLTSLLNRRAFLELAQSMCSNATRHNRPLALIMIDLDHFKQINDMFGHHVGDQTLIKAAHVLLQECRNADILARWGGEEFILLLQESDLEHAHYSAERLRTAIEQTTLLDSIKLTASFGVAALQPGLSLEELIKAADDRLYDAKHQGRNRVVSVVAATA